MRTRPMSSGRRAPLPVRSGGGRSPRPEQALSFSLTGMLVQQDTCERETLRAKGNGWPARAAGEMSVGGLREDDSVTGQETERSFCVP